MNQITAIFYLFKLHLSYSIDEHLAKNIISVEYIHFYAQFRKKIKSMLSFKMKLNIFAIVFRVAIHVFVGSVFVNN